MVRKKHGMARYIRAQSMVWFGAHAAHHMGDSLSSAAHQLFGRLNVNDATTCQCRHSIAGSRDITWDEKSNLSKYCVAQIFTNVNSWKTFHLDWVWSPQGSPLCSRQERHKLRWYINDIYHNNLLCRFYLGLAWIHPLFQSTAVQ